MTQIKVILTKEAVYTTLEKTIHARDAYAVENPDDRYNDQATITCRSLAFSLATRSVNPACEEVDLSKQVMTDQSIFEYLDKCHQS